MESSSSSSSSSSSLIDQPLPFLGGQSLRVSTIPTDPITRQQWQTTCQKLPLRQALALGADKFAAFRPRIIRENSSLAPRIVTEPAFLLPCRCPACLAGTVVGANVTHFEKSIFHATTSSAASTSSQGSRAEREGSVLVLDRDGFVSWEHPLVPEAMLEEQLKTSSMEELSRKSSCFALKLWVGLGMRKHVAQANGLTKESQLPTCLQLPNGRGEALWLGLREKRRQMVLEEEQPRIKDKSERKEPESKAKKEIGRLHDLNAKLQNENSTLRAQVKGCEQALKEAERVKTDELARLEKNRDSMQAEIATLQAQLEQNNTNARARESAKDEELDRLKKEIAEMTDENGRLHVQLNNQQENGRALKQEKTRLEERIGRLTTEQQEKESHIETLKQRVARGDNHIEKLKAENRSLEKAAEARQEKANTQASMLSQLSKIMAQKLGCTTNLKGCTMLEMMNILEGKLGELNEKLKESRKHDGDNEFDKEDYLQLHKRYLERRVRTGEDAETAGGISLRRRGFPPILESSRDAGFQKAWKLVSAVKKSKKSNHEKDAQIYKVLRQLRDFEVEGVPLAFAANDCDLESAHQEVEVVEVVDLTKDVVELGGNDED